MSKRRLPMTRRVRDGLRSMAANIEAGSAADFTGYDEEQMTKEQFADWEDVLQAVRWINSLPGESSVPTTETKR